MSTLTIPNEIGRTTEICRICLSQNCELQSIYSFGRILDTDVRLVDIVSDCTSIEFNPNDMLPESICNQCLVRICKIYKFREMAFRSNFMLRQKLIKKQPPPLRTYTVNKRKQTLNKTALISAAVESNNCNLMDQPDIDLFIEETNENIDEADDVEYLTVLVANDDTTESGNETIECLIADPNESEEQQNESVTDEVLIPKMSLANYRRRTKSERNDKSLTCHQCNKTLSNLSSFKYHMQLHSDDTPYLCSDCGMGFKTKNAYDGHMMTHLKINPNQCLVCNKVYRQAASLRSHMLTHTGDKPFKCDLCGKSMTQRSGFKKHMLIHSGEMPHSCDVCAKKFRYSSNLIMHKRSHVGERPFECTVQNCKKKFLSKEQLKRHTTIHSGLRPYECSYPDCGKAFNRRSTLNIHQKVHANNVSKKSEKKSAKNENNGKSRETESE